MKHGVLAIFTTIDVIVINRIPIRLKQIGYVYLFQLTYFLWSIIHFAFDIGTPYGDNDTSTDDDAIYSVVNWKKRPGSAMKLSSYF